MLTSVVTIAIRDTFLLINTNISAFYSVVTAFMWQLQLITVATIEYTTRRGNQNSLRVSNVGCLNHKSIVPTNFQYKHSSLAVEVAPKIA